MIRNHFNAVRKTVKTDNFCDALQASATLAQVPSNQSSTQNTTQVFMEIRLNIERAKLI